MSEQATGNNGKYIIGVTGNIATGKSIVLRLGAEEGALVIDADRLVHEIMDSDSDMQAAIAVAFGPETRRPDGRINRRALGDIVFSDANALSDLEEMVHPAVHKEVTRRLAESDKPVAFIEAIKLLEGKLADSCQQVWVTRCSKQRQLERLRVCRGLDTQSAAARIKAQSSQEDKVALADVVIDTNGSMIETETQFQEAWDSLPDTVKVKPKATKEPPTKLKLKPKPKTEPAAAPAQEPAKKGTKTRLSKDTARLLNIPKPKKQSTIVDTVKARSTAPPKTAKAPAAAGAVEVRRARPPDIPSILLLIQKATDGALKMKRAELLMALSERSYFIGQIGADVSAIIGWNIDTQIARIDQIFVYPPEAISDTGLAIVEEIEKSAKAHICELIITFLANDTSDELRQLFKTKGYDETDKESLPAVWQRAVDESQPDGTFFMIKILRDERLKKARVS
jgi:dephospho-CoA kinase